MKEFHKAISGRLGKQFALYIIIFSSCFTLVSTSVQLAFDYRAEISRIEQQFVDINNSHVQSLSLGLWSMDTAQVAAQLEGLVRLPDIEHAVIFDGDELLWQSGNKVAQKSRIEKYRLGYSEAREDPIYLGDLIVTANVDNVYDRLISRASVILISNGIKTFIVAGFIMFLIWWRVTRHLEAFYQYVTGFNVSKPNEPLALSKKVDPDNPDEFDIVADAINLMNQSLTDSFVSLQKAEDNLKRLLIERSRLLDSEREHKEQLEGKVFLRTEELTKSEQALKRSYAQLQNILETSPIAVGVYNLQAQKTVFSNHTCANMFGFSLPEWLEHNPVESWKNKQDREHYIQEYRQVGRVETREVLMVRKNLSEFWALLTWEKITFKDQQNILFWVVDIDEQKKAQQLLEQATQSKSDFLANMSHEIRTPMNAVLGFSHLALQTELTDQQHDYLSKIQRASHNLLRVINDILDLSKIEAGKLEVESVPFSLDDVLEHLCDLMRLKVEEKGLEILLFHPWELPRELKGDALRLGQVLANLVSNAIKFTEQGEISVRVEEVAREDDLVTLRFSVTDTGIGLTDKEMGYLFQPFSQADSTTTRLFGGTGLGLVISKQLVELMNGEISVTSTKGRGSCFSFTCQFGLDAPLLLENQLCQSLQGIRVLIVDDSETCRDVLSSIVCNLGMYCYTVSSGEAAIEELNRCQQEGEASYDLLLLDWHMPGLDGFACAQQIKSMSNNQPLPALVMVTAHSHEGVLGEGNDELLDGFLLKPVSPSLLIGAIQSALGIKSFNSKPTLHHISEVNHLIKEVRGKHILLVEDNVINQQIAKEMLAKLKLTVDIANNGVEAVECVQQGVFDLVLMDIQMPIMDGLDATKAIRQFAHCKSLPIIAMTANAMPEDVQRSLDAGMNDHLFKPIEPEKLHDLLYKWFTDNFSSSKKLMQERHTGVVLSVDSDTALSRLNNDSNLYAKLLHDFFSEHSETFDAIVRQMDDGEYEAGEKLAHTFAGVAGNLGANELFRSTQQLERLLHNKQKSQIDTVIEICKKNLVQFKQEIQPYLQMDPESAEERDRSEGPHDLSFEELSQALRECLEEGDSHSRQYLDQLEIAIDYPVSVHFSKLKELIEDYDFEEALITLDHFEDEIAKV
jgi:signal transduction histidine kinase/CheY-like chemotaxis protein